MSDEHLTNHEWKLKMAAEGKAFYRPGETVAEARERLDRDTISVTMTVGQAQALETAIVDLPELTYQIADALGTLAGALSIGSLDDRDLQPILALFERALNSATTIEIPVIQTFDPLLRDTLSDYLNAQRQAQSKGEPEA